MYTFATSGIQFLLLGWLSLLASIAALRAQSVHLPSPEVITDRQGLPQAFVPAIVQDKLGFIWMATRDGLCRYDGNVFKVFQPSSNGNPPLALSEIVQMVPDRQGKIWLISEAGELDLFDPARETFVNVSRQSFYQRWIGSHVLESAYVDSRNQLWLCIRGQGLARLDLPTRQISRYRKQAGQATTLRSDSVLRVIEDRQDKHILWLASRAGLERMDQRTSQFKHYDYQLGDALSGSDKTVKNLIQLPNGALLVRSNEYVCLFDPSTQHVRSVYKLPVKEPWWRWAPLALTPDGEVLVSQQNRLYRFTEHEGLRLEAQLPVEPFAQSLWVDQSAVLWVGTNGGGVVKYNLKASAFRAFPYHVSFHHDALVDQLGLEAGRLPNLPATWSYQLRSTVDGQRKFWFNIRTEPFYRVDLATKEMTPIPFPVHFSAAWPDHPVPLATDPEGHVWAVYDSLAMWYDEPQKRWVAFPHPFQHRATGVSVESTILAVVVDQQALWMATKARGLYRVDRRTGSVRRYGHDPKNRASISNDHLFCLSADPGDTTLLWVGTFGSGLCRFDKRTGRSRRLTTADGLPNNVIYAAIPDQQGSLWVATNQGLGRLDRRTLKTRIYTREDGMAGDEFNRHHFIQLPNGRILLGGLDGITTFDPTTLREDPYQPPVQITSIQVNNQPLRAGGVPAQMLSSLTLPYDQNFVTVQFASMQYNRRGKLRYRYQLDGLESGWIQTDRPITVYTGLQPGHYTLRLNAANTAGIWSPYIRTLQLTIKPPLWATWWAMVLYGLIGLGIGWGLLHMYLNRLRLQQAIRLRQQEADQLRVLDTMKTHFFTNITHEFRTPLTLILAPTEQMARENPEPKNRRRLELIEQNAHQLLGLINQLLDLAKLEAAVMPIHESRGNLTESIRHWLQPLTDQATAQGLGLLFTSELVGDYWFDAEKLERIVNNLTANALKFTKVGTITLSLTEASGRIQLTIIDTGIGIPAQHLPHIFDRFYQVRTPSTGDANPIPGTGVGLALVQELVKLQGGHISVESRLHQGTTFVVELPCRRVESTELASNEAAPWYLGTNNEAWTAPDETDEPALLVVEDNNELARLIADSLPQNYRIRRAINGLDGLQQALDYMPDLIISDVMMPLMDGFTLCSELKTDQRTSHIPLILLTAKSSVENRLAGLSLGADEYLTKPFQITELQLRVRNQLVSRQRHREWVQASMHYPGPASPPPGPEPTDPFLTRLHTMFEAHLSDSKFGLEQMTDELGMSRLVLFRKVKALTGLSAPKLFHHYRLKQASQLLRSGVSVSETAYQVGFESHAYFSKCFRDVYQMSPSEFAAQA